MIDEKSKAQRVVNRFVIFTVTMLVVFHIIALATVPLGCGSYPEREQLEELLYSARASIEYYQGESAKYKEYLENFPDSEKAEEWRKKMATADLLAEHTMMIIERQEDELLASDDYIDLLIILTSEAGRSIPHPAAPLVAALVMTVLTGIQTYRRKTLKSKTRIAVDDAESLFKDLEDERILEERIGKHLGAKKTPKKE